MLSVLIFNIEFNTVEALGWDFKTPEKNFLPKYTEFRSYTEVLAGDLEN